jgi:polyisoprenoid-binding protein YceI
MIKQILLVAAAATLGMSSPGKAGSPSGALRVDSHYSTAQFSTDGTTDFGKKKTTFTVGVGRVIGKVMLDNNDPSQSTFDFSIYPATSMVRPIDEDGKIRSEWASNAANHTMVCFHSKGVTQTPDGRLKTTGKLVLTRVDRNIQADPSEGYSGPVYGPPMIHRFSQEATFVFDQPTALGGSQADSGRITGSAKLFHEDFPQLVKTVVGTYWPPVIEDEHCQTPSVGEDFSGIQCTGTLIKTPDFPASGASPSEDYPGPPNFNIVTGEHLTIAVDLRLAPRGGMQATGGN